MSTRPDFEARLFPAELSAAWPKFAVSDPIADLFYGVPYRKHYRDFILIAFDDSNPDEMLARACSVPFYWTESELPDGGWDSVVQCADSTQRSNLTPNFVSALEITIHPKLSGRGLSAEMLNALRENARGLGFKNLYAPVRPNQKHLEPLTPMSEYLSRMRPDGLPFDAWLRVHVRAGGRILKIAPHSMTISGTVEQWREWTQLGLNESGPTIVPGALVPVWVSLEQNVAVYVEPNVWVCHSL